MPGRLAVDDAGPVYVADSGHHRIRRISHFRGPLSRLPVRKHSGNSLGHTLYRKSGYRGQ
jgi:hypothetical protein